MRISCAGFFVLCCFLLLPSSSAHQKNEFTEELILKRVASNLVLSQLNFKFSERVSDPHLVKFNPVLYSLLSNNHLWKLEFSISQGFWRNSLYGQPPELGGAPGVYVVAYFDHAFTRSEEQWPTLIEQLNGLFCSSFAIIGQSLNSPLKFSKAAFSVATNGTVVYGAFTGDNICTENAEAFKKLLPCQRLGLSELLTNAAELYDSLFYSMAFSVTLRPSGLWSSHVQMNLLKPSISSKQLSVFSIFRQKITSVCPVATKSTVVLEESPKRTIELDANEKNGPVANPVLNMTTATMEKNFIEFSLFTRESFFVRGKFISTIKSTANTPTRAVFVHLLPWQLHLWHSTVRLACNGLERKPHMRFSPKHGRNAPVLIEMMVDIPPQSQCEISYSFQKGFLRFDEYPPDSSSGIHVPGPILNILPGQWSQSAIQIHAESTIILLPIPDFSMPFNVICFVCTFVAFLFQLLLTFTTKYPSVVESPSKSLVAKVIEKVRKLGEKFRKKQE